MIFYFDTSAFVPLLVSEPGSGIAKQAWLAAAELRGYDAVHCASAEALGTDVAFVSGDSRLLRVCGELGMNTVDTNR